jgi:hypothetical protein
MVEQPRASNERWHDARHPRPDHAPLPLRARCLAPDADLIRMTPMLAAARRVLFPRCRDRDRNADLGSVVAGCPRQMKQPGAAKRDERPQLTRMKNDPKSFVLCPYNARFQLRRLIIASAADGCKSLLDSPHQTYSAARSCAETFETVPRGSHGLAASRIQQTDLVDGVFHSPEVARSARDHEIVYVG